MLFCLLAQETFEPDKENQKTAHTPETFFRAVQAAKRLYLDDVFL